MDLSGGSALVIVIHSLVFAAGLFIVWITINSATRTFVLPRSVSDTIARPVFLALRRLFDLRLRHTSDYLRHDSVMALYAPTALLVLLVVWLILVQIGYILMFWALGPLIGISGWTASFASSGSSLLTLGFAAPTTILAMILTFSEATVGLILVALLIAYLPTMYTAFSRRELAVTLLEVRAGSPPTAVEMISRFCRLQRLHLLNSVWTSWETWFAEVEESHTSLAALAFFRSPQPMRSWVNAAGAVLDAAALTNAVVDLPHDPQADLCLRAGYLALRNITRLYRISVNENPHHTDPLSITRAEFDAGCAYLANQKVPLIADREQAWRDFAGWRVNYDDTLLRLRRLTMAPTVPWIPANSLLLPSVYQRNIEQDSLD